MKSLYRPTDAFNPDRQWHALPNLLNFHKCSVQDLAALRLVEYPALTMTVLLGVMEQIIGLSDKAKAHRKAAMRHAYRQPGRGTTQWSRRLVDASGLKAQVLESIIDRQRLQNEFITVDGQVKSIKRAGFGYAPSDYSGELEMWSTLECGKCGHEESVREQGEEEALEASESFDPVSGPYHRCSQCDAVTRVKWASAEDLPNGADIYEAGDNWDNYVEHLGELVCDMTDELNAQGLPEPDGLRIEVTAFGWQKRDAYGLCKFEGEALADTMRVNGDFNISNGAFTVTKTGYCQLSCFISHHDGSSPIVVFPYWECEVDSDVHVYQEDWPMIRSTWLPASELLLCGRGEPFPYTDASKWTIATREGLADEFGSMVRIALLAEDDEDVGGYERAVRLLADGLLEEINHPEPRPGFLVRVKQFRQVFDCWLETTTE